MKILGIDTTTKSASCTILDEDKYYTKTITNEVTHSEKMLPIIHDTLKENNLTLDDISMYAAINGPGSFTGIRIGLATIKAFAQVKDVEIFSISSTDLISYVAFRNSNEKEKLVVSLIDARNDRVYFSVNRLTRTDDGKVTIEKVVDVGNELIDDVLTTLPSDNVIVAGNCVEKFKDKLSAKYTLLQNLYPTTQDLIDCYKNLKETTSYMYNAYSLDALYARPSQAERVSNNG